jgi:hypothetical protein
MKTESIIATVNVAKQMLVEGTQLTEKVADAVFKDVINGIEKLGDDLKNERKRNWFPIENDYDRSISVIVLKSKNLMGAIKELGLWNRIKDGKRHNNVSTGAYGDSVHINFYHHCGHEHDCCGCVHQESFTLLKWGDTFLCKAGVGRNY